MAAIREVTEDRARFEKSPEREALEEFFKAQKPGAELGWMDIAAATGVNLGASEDGERNREIARAAIVSSGHKGGWEAIPGWGIKLAGPENVTSIGRRRSRKIGRQIDKAVRESEGALALDLDPITRQAMQWRRDAYKIAQQSQRNDLGALPAPPSDMDKRPMLPKAREA